MTEIITNSPPNKNVPIIYYDMRYLPLENRSSELRRISASRSKGTNRRRRSAPSGTRKHNGKSSLNLHYGQQPLPEAIKPSTLKALDNVEDLSKRIDHLEKEHSEMMAEHKTILEKTEGIEKTHSLIMKEHKMLMGKTASIEARVLFLEATRKKGGATRRKRRAYYK